MGDLDRLSQESIVAMQDMAARGAMFRNLNAPTDPAFDDVLGAWRPARTDWQENYLSSPSNASHHSVETANSAQDDAEEESDESSESGTSEEDDEKKKISRPSVLVTASEKLKETLSRRRERKRLK